MKYVFLAFAGAADEPLPALSNRTALEAARLPNLARLASRGQVGQVFPLGEEATSSSFSAGAVSMALFGCDPDRYYQGPGPLEATAAQVPLSPRDIAFCGSFIASDGVNIAEANPAITPEEMQQLTQALQDRLGSPPFAFFPGAGSRAVLRWQDGERDVATTPPPRLMPGSLAPYLPQGDGSERLRALIFDSLQLLDDHEINQQRKGDGKPKINTFWPWGQGETVTVPTLLGRFGKTGAAQAQSGLIQGIAASVGMHLVNSSTSASAENFTTATARLLDALEGGADLAFFHTLAASRASQSGDGELKVHTLEQIDRQIVGPLVEGLQKRGLKFRLLATPVHQTLTDGGGSHTIQPVPFLSYDSTRETDNKLPWEERVLPDTRVTVPYGYQLIGRLFS